MSDASVGGLWRSTRGFGVPGVGIALGALLLSFAGAAPGKPLPAPPGLDHFKCYTATQQEFKAPPTLKVKDQFGARAVKVLRQRTLCNPVSKNGGRILYRQAHLSCYLASDTQGAFKPRKAEVSNQFGTKTVVVRKPQGLCVPSLKAKPPAPPAGPDPEKVVDHFRCYTVDPVDVGKSVKTRDQFGLSATKVYRIVELCAPVSKNGGAVQRPRAHLACYFIKDAHPAGGLDVRVRNQFGVATVKVIRPSLLCLPSFKKLLG